MGRIVRQLTLTKCPMELCTQMFSDTQERFEKSLFWKAKSGWADWSKRTGTRSSKDIIERYFKTWRKHFFRISYPHFHQNRKLINLHVLMFFLKNRHSKMALQPLRITMLRPWEICWLCSKLDSNKFPLFPFSSWGRSAVTSYAVTPGQQMHCNSGPVYLL